MSSCIRNSLTVPFILGCQLTFLLSISVAQHGDESELAGKRPNIILIITDDQGYGPIGRHGHPWIRTPNLDSLYDNSLRFTRFLVSPTCAPTRSALMTGRHPMRNGVTHTILERERMTLDAKILPQVLKSAGYTTGIFGKWHLGDEEAYQPHQRGFDEAFIHGAGGIGQAYQCSCADVPDNKYFDPVIRRNGSFVKTNGYCTDIFFKAAMGWIKKVKDNDEPFFAYVSTNAPHGPFIAPQKNAEYFEKLGFSKKYAGFYGMIENIDENIGVVLGCLNKWNLLEDTVVIFMSDNGMTGNGAGPMGKALGTFPDGTSIFPFNADMKGLKGDTNEGGVRVPFFVRWDGRIKPNRDIAQITAHIDVLPTLAALAGAKPPMGQVEGRSLLPLIEHKKPNWDDRVLFTHVGRWKTGEDPDKFQWKNFAVRNQRFRMVGTDSLFDMQNDPGQKINVIDQHPEAALEMWTAYDAWWRATRPLMVNETAPMSPTRPFHELYNKQLKIEGIPDWKEPSL